MMDGMLRTLERQVAQSGDREAIIRLECSLSRLAFNGDVEAALKLQTSLMERPDDVAACEELWRLWTYLLPDDHELIWDWCPIRPYTDDELVQLTIYEAIKDKLPTSVAHSDLVLSIARQLIEDVAKNYRHPGRMVNLESGWEYPLRYLVHSEDGWDFCDPPCRYCEVLAHELCKTRDGNIAKRPHKHRKVALAAKEATKAQAWAVNEFFSQEDTP